VPPSWQEIARTTRTREDTKIVRKRFFFVIFVYFVVNQVLDL